MAGLTWVTSSGDAGVEGLGVYLGLPGARGISFQGSRKGMEGQESSI